MAIGIFKDRDMNMVNGEVLTVTITLEEYRDLVKGSTQNEYKVLNDVLTETASNLRKELVDLRAEMSTVKMERDTLYSEVHGYDVQTA